MEIKDLVISKIYKREDLMHVFKNNSFMRGMNICNNANPKCLVLISVHHGNRDYDDTWEGPVLHYTGEGLRGDQKISNANKVLAESIVTKIPVYLFVRYQNKEYRYYGLVSLVGEPYTTIENDIDGNPRYVYKFPIALLSDPGIRPLTKEEMQQIRPGTAKRILPEYNVVGAAIFDNGRVMCVQKSKGFLLGKWEFPGGKIEANETPENALVREIHEELELGIKVDKFIESTTFTYPDRVVHLNLYRCSIEKGKPVLKEHSDIKWCSQDDLDIIDWADADAELIDEVKESFPLTIVGKPDQYTYYEAKPECESKSSLRDNQDYERSQRIKTLHGNEAEEAVVQLEKSILNAAGRADLSINVRRVSQISNGFGYDVLSYEPQAYGNVEKHIEVKYVKKTSGYITFFISSHELELFKGADPLFQIYCVYKEGKNLRYHIINKNYWKDEYLKPLNYQVRIKIAK